jgi:hypothetical protein
VSNVILFLNEQPGWIAFAIVLAFYEAFAIGVTLVTRRLYAIWDFPKNATFVPPWVQLVGALNALLFAFVIVSLWQTLHATEVDVDTEAYTVRVLYRDILPSQRPLVIAYGQAVADGFPLLCEGHGTTRSATLLHQLERNGEPAQPSLRGELNRELATLEDLRSRRVHAAVSGVPDELWLGLIALSLILIAMTSFVQPERGDMHVALVAFVAFAIALVFWVAASLDFPYCGGTTISPVPLQQTLDGLRGG